MVQQQQLQLPNQRDPIARLALFALGGAALCHARTDHRDRDR